MLFDMRKIVLVVFCANTFWVSCQELHFIDPKPGVCYDVYSANQPIFLSKSNRACTKVLSEYKNCLGLKTKNNETIIVGCKERPKTATGCYRIINPDKTEGSVCQKLDQGRGCEIIMTPTSLYVEVFCHPLEKTGNTIFLRKLKPGRLNFYPKLT